MGQLEKYGLYVMCLVIFLILGVTLWGEPANAQRASGASGGRGTAINASVAGGASGAETASFSPGRSQLDDLLVRAELPPPAPERGRLSSLLESPPKPKAAPKVAPKAAPKAAPKVEPKVAPKPKPVALRTRYKVKRGDSLGLIAQRECGTVKMKGKILELNPSIKNEHDIQVGQELVLPGGDQARGVGRKSANKAVASGAYRTHKVRKGDNMEDIAAQKLGSRKRVGEIKKMNANVNPERMRIGTMLKIPLK